MLEAVLADEVCQDGIGRGRTVSQRQAILQVVDGQHDYGKPLLNGFKGLQAEITQPEGVFQVEVIHFYTPTLLVISQDLLCTQGQIGANKVLGELIPGAFFRDDCVDRFSKILQVSLNAAGVIPGSFAMFVHSLERDALVRPVPEHLVVLRHAYFVDPSIGLDGTDDMPLLFTTEFDQFLGSVPGVKEHLDFVTLG